MKFKLAFTLGILSVLLMVSQSISAEMDAQPSSGTEITTTSGDLTFNPLYGFNMFLREVIVRSPTQPAINIQDNTNNIAVGLESRTSYGAGGYPIRIYTTSTTPITLSGASPSSYGFGHSLLLSHLIFVGTNANQNFASPVATLYIDGPPVAGTNVTFQGGAYALYIANGIGRFDGNGTYVFELPADNSDPTRGGSSASGRIPVLIGGTLKYLAYYDAP